QEKYQLPFELLSDPEHKVIEQYDVWKEKSMYGKKYMGIVRSTYLIDEEGNIEKALEKVKPQQNPEQMLKLVEDL
ncbi:peroxiredoxin, partial [Dubosiella newyorkensis]